MQTMVYEIGRIRRNFLDQPQGAIGPKLLDTIREGLAISDDTYLALRRTLDTWRDEFFTDFAGTDAILWPATPKTAPLGLEWTGDASFIAPWTTLGGPVVTMPVGKSSAGMPIGCLLAGMPGSDFAFAATARHLAEGAEDRDQIF
jgi:amidase